jgi:hypothetical protein
MRAFRIAAAVVALTATLAAAAPAVWAATPAPAETGASGLTVGPAIIEQPLEVGKPVTRTVTVSNATSRPLPVHASAASLVPGQPLQSINRNIFDASKWFTLSEPDFILQPEQAKTVTFTLRAPAGAEPGGHYATLYFRVAEPQSSANGTATKSTAQVGVLAFLIVKGAIKHNLDSGGIAVHHLQQKGPVKVAVTVNDTGNVHELPSGSLVIRDHKGTAVKRFDLPSGLVLPGTAHTYAFNWQSGANIGRFAASTEINYGPGHTMVEVKPVTFWILPTWALSLMGLIAVALVAAAWLSHGRWKNALRALIDMKGPYSIRKQK